MTRNSRHRWRVASMALIPVLACMLVYFFWPRAANLRGFDPESVSRIEALMWRRYYDRQYPGLFSAFYALARNEYHFSPWDSARLSFCAAKAAAVFQRSRSRAEAQQALPTLECYYGIIRAHGGEEFDAPEVARLELEWWQLRREKAPPARYGEVVAEAAAKLYRTNNEALRQSGKVRAEMMFYRDERRDMGLGEDDWRHIEEGLADSYRALQAGIGGTPAPRR